MRRRETRYPVRLTIPVDTATRDRFDAAADRYGVSRNAIVRRALSLGARSAIDAVRREAKGEAADGADPTMVVGNPTGDPDERTVDAHGLRLRVVDEGRDE